MPSRGRRRPLSPPPIGRQRASRSRTMTDEATARPPLFRPEVAQRNWEILASKGLMPKPPLFIGAVILLLLTAFAGGGFSCPRRHPARRAGPGLSRAGGRRARVRAPRQAIVEAVHVKDGQLVQRGDLLVTLQSGQSTVTGATAETEISVSCTPNGRTSKPSSPESRTGGATRIAGSTPGSTTSLHDLDLLERNIATQQEQMALAQRQAERIRGLVERGTISLDELQRREIAALTQKLAVQTSERDSRPSAPSSCRRVSPSKQLPMLASERPARLARVARQRAATPDRARSAPLGGGAGADHRPCSPPSRRWGSAVDNGGLIATIVPDDAELRARLFVPTRSIGKVHAGQSVSCGIRRLPYQKYGSFQGAGSWRFRVPFCCPRRSRRWRRCVSPESAYVARRRPRSAGRAGRRLGPGATSPRHDAHRDDRGRSAAAARLDRRQPVRRFPVTLRSARAPWSST